tara:strand:+ start:59283 stop:60167 length:885 start_codon:yes stop_codon:yes gene_type:complete
MKLKTLLSVATAALFAFFSTSTLSAAVVGLEDFDGGATNLLSTTNVFDYGAGGGSGGDVFGRVQPFSTGAPFDLADDSAADVSGDGTGGAFPTDSRGVIGQNSSSVFGLVDSDGNIDGMGNPLNDAVWSFDISSATSITSVNIDMGAMGDFEAASQDGFRIDAQLDGGGYTTIFLARPDESIDLYTYRAMDSGTAFSENDPLELFIDGALTSSGILDKSVAATGALDTYSSLLFAGQSGSTLDIRVSWDGNPSGSEAMAIDNISILGTTAIPEPSAFAALALAGLGGVIRRRRR